jgi:acetyl esterase/lipase
MKYRVIICLSIVLLYSIQCWSQKVVRLYEGKAAGSENWNWSEKQMFSPIFNTQIVYNVTDPTLTVFLPEKSIATGMAVIIAPGGGFHTLSINSEGIDLAKWLNKKGIAAFVLKYRLVHSETDDPVKELMGKMSDPEKMKEATAQGIPMSIADGLTAMKYVKTNAQKFGIDPAKIGFLGFSAGGTVTMGVAYQYDKETKPLFAAPIYPFISEDLANAKVPDDAPPLFICAASDDQLKLATHSSNLYSKWHMAGKQAELHMYAKGGHGFGMRKQNLPSDKWVERFYEWLRMQKYIK